MDKREKKKKNSVTSCKIRAYHTRVKANRESSWCGLSKKLFKDLEGCSRKNKSNARYERGKPGKPNVFQQTFFFPHFLQRLVTHLYLRKQNELVSISLFLFSFSGRSLTSLDSKVITLTLDIWMGRARAVGGGLSTCDTSRAVRAFLVGGHPWQTTSAF